MKLHGLSFKPRFTWESYSSEEWEEIIELEERLCDSIRILFPIPDDIDERTKVRNHIETLKELYDNEDGDYVRPQFNITSIVIAAKCSYEKYGRVLAYDDDDSEWKMRNKSPKITTV